MGILDILYNILFMPLQLVFEILYVLTNRMINDPGLSIIALSLMMNFLVLPLYMRADAMQEHERVMENKLRDGVNHIKKTFKGDEKMMILQTYYRQNDYKPTDVFKGSISLFLEIPFFVAAYMFLSHLESIQGVPFGIIRDLGAPDALLAVGGISINVLPFVMTGINLISCALFTKGMPAKTKLQLYGMALFFLVFLYGSPAGLVFYWTLNNVFALVKTIFYKLKNPKKVLVALFALVGAVLLVYGVFFFHNPNPKKVALVILLGIGCMVPFLVTQIKARTSLKVKGLDLKPNKKVFVAGVLFLTVLMGLLIPSAAISSSPQEFLIYQTDFALNPLWYVVSAFTLSAGMFLVWFGVFYWLCNDRAKAIFELGVVAACCVSVVDYLLFGTDLGNLSATLQYSDMMVFGFSEILLNSVAVVAIVAAAVVAVKVLGNNAFRALSVVIVAMVVLSGYNLVNVGKSVNAALDSLKVYGQQTASFGLSKEGKNVVVLMLDRGLGQLVPYLFNEKPELQEKFSGFTYYSNVISFGGVTNMGMPALVGGYEYTPEEINKRSEESLESKHNEALKVMPALFDGEGYDVTVCDPTYAGYGWIPDLSIFEEYPNVKAYNTKGTFYQNGEEVARNNKRNFFLFGITKSLPVVLQSTLYSNGSYCSSRNVIQTIAEDASHAEGLDPNFMDCYTVLENMPAMTKVVDGGKNTFLFMTNDTPHSPALLQEGDYTPAESVDNSVYDEQHRGRFEVNGNSITVSDELQMSHYHANMAAFLQLANWFDYLKANEVYDNTRIILVSDHGFILNMTGELTFSDNGMAVNTEAAFPLLMVKDFGSKEFTTSTDFMTNGDVPAIAMEGLINGPVNPFTGKSITNDAKQGPQYIYYSDQWNTGSNSGNVFLPGGTWMSVKEDARNMSNWSIVEDPNAH